jgi:periplasmic divalent cation tolerance protein
VKQPEIGACVVITTCASDEEATSIAKALLDARLAACIQVTGIQSHYVWKGERVSEPEKLLLVKTRMALYPRVEAAILAAHSYDVPEVICLPVAAGSPAYLGWIGEVTTQA